MKKKLILFFAVVCFTISFGTEVFPEGAGEKNVRIKTALHINSNVTSGKYSPEKLAAMALEKGLDAIFITEDFYPRIEYGALPFRGIIKKVHEFSGLYKYGTGEYFNRIGTIDEKLDDIHVLMSAEVTPFYFWTGKPYREDFTLNDWDIQFLVFGLDPDEYEGMPTISGGNFSKIDIIALLKLWPILLLLLGILLLKRKYCRIYINNALPWLMIVVGIFYSLYHFPFKHLKYDQYHDRILPGAYQDLIDYVNEKGGMLFWSAPEAQTYRRFGPVLFVSSKATEHMLSTRDYTGFCVFYEGYRDIGGPGGIWDKILTEYCGGEREKPVWVIGESAFHDEKSSGGKEMDDVQTVFFTAESNKVHLLDAMRNGSMYAVRKGKSSLLELEDLYITAAGGEKAFMGEEIVSGGPVKIHFDIGWKGSPLSDIKVTIIRNGDVIHEIEVEQPGEIVFSDDYWSPGEKIYYRLDARGKYPGMLFSNPIFVSFIEKEKE